MSAFAPKDRPLIERVYEKNEATLRKFVFHRLKDEEKTKDVIQEVAINFMEAFDSLTLVKKSIDEGMPEDFYSIDLMNAYASLGKIIGEEVDDDLVEEIFSKFCMGK